MYRYELHCHTCETSPCGKLPAAEMVRQYHDLGYQGMCITDHMMWKFTDMVPDETWDARVDRYLKGYKAAKEEGDRLGMDIILGMEITFRPEPFRDYGVFGIDEAWLRSHPNPLDMTLKEFYTRFGKELLIIQCHPYRDNDVIFEGYFHGIEVVNRHPRSVNRNDMAIALAKKHPECFRTVGSDAHRTTDVARTAFLTEERIHDSFEMKRAIESRNYLLWHNEWNEEGETFTPEEIVEHIF